MAGSISGLPTFSLGELRERERERERERGGRPGELILAQCGEIKGLFRDYARIEVGCVKLSIGGQGLGEV